jgi:hypothetical protein
MSVERLREALSGAGFAVHAVGKVGPYNREVGAIAPAFVLPDFDREDALVLLVGNGGELLGALRDAATRDPELAEDPDPIERYSRETITAVAREHLAGHRAELRFTSDPPPHTFAAVRLARLLGLAETGPTQLSIHPERGPWIALRAAIVVDAPGPEPTPAPSSCAACSGEPCVPAMTRALEAIGGLVNLGRPTLRRHADLFIAARDACPLGRAHRYPEPLLRYHYTVDRRLLFPG